MATSYNHFGEIADRIKPFCQNVVKATAHEVQSGAKAGAAVDTGFMRENVYVATWEGSDYGTGGISAPGKSYLLPEVKPDNDTTAIIGAAASHSIYQEMGTRFMPAHPFFYQAVWQARPFFESELAKLEAVLHV
jgi:HK97 gp10 family phage protein